MNNTSDAYYTGYVDPRSGGSSFRTYYIAAEEITWDYGISKPHQLINNRSELMLHFVTFYYK